MLRRQAWQGMTMLGATVIAWPRGTRAQSGASLPKLGIIYPGPKQAFAPRLDAIVTGLRVGGFSGQQLDLVVRTGEGDPAQVQPMVADVVAQKVAAIIAIGRPALQAAYAATRTIPIISYNLETDPLAEGYANSLASPGGNVTGIFFDFPNFAAKLIELLIEVTGKLSRVAVFWEPSTGPVQVESAKAAAQAFRVDFEILETRTGSDYAPAYAAAKQRGADGAVLLSSPLVLPNAKELVDLAFQHRLPTITIFPEYARTGGLLAYGPNLLAMYRQAGIFAAKAMRGVDVANLPIERPTKFELIVNQRTALALGLSMQATLVLRADEVID